MCSPVPWFPGITARRADPGPEQDSWEGLDVHRPRFFYFPGVLKNLDSRFYARGVRQWLRAFSGKWKPHLLDAHFLWPDGVAVASLARDLGLPYAITLRGKIYECLPIRSQREQCAKALAGASAVFSNSSLMAQEARKLGTPESRLKVIPNGVDPRMFYPQDRQRCRQALGLPIDAHILVTVAHLGHRKGHVEVIRALAGLPEDVVLVIVGGPAQGGTAEELEAVASECGVNERLLLPGRQPYEKVPLFLNAADAGVLASYREGCPNAVLETLACGRPVVATDVGAVRDILPQPDAGRIVPRGDVAALRNALVDVLGRDWVPDEVVDRSGVRSWDEVAGEVQSMLVGVLSR